MQTLKIGQRQFVFHRAQTVKGALLGTITSPRGIVYQVLRAPESWAGGVGSKSAKRTQSARTSRAKSNTRTTAPVHFEVGRARVKCGVANVEKSQRTKSPMGVTCARCLRGVSR